MLRFTTGNLLESDVEAIVNTVNTVGVMGKGIALMFKESFPENFRAYRAASKKHEIAIGHMFVTQTGQMYGPKWIINFPTKEHWRSPSQLEWITEGLQDLRRVIRDKGIRSIAIPPLGAGNGGLEWTEVRREIQGALSDLNDVEVLVFEPVEKYQNVQKRAGVGTLTIARALLAEAVRRYWVLGIECTILEVQKLAWFIETTASELGLNAPFEVDFKPERYGPYSDELRHLLNALDGSYLHCDKRINDASPRDVIRFDDAQRDVVELYLATEGKAYIPVLDAASRIIDGFESPLGMEVLSTIDWLLREGVEPSVPAMLDAIAHWPAGEDAARRKLRIFEPRLIELALKRLTDRSRLLESGAGV